LNEKEQRIVKDSWGRVEEGWMVDGFALQIVNKKEGEKQGWISRVYSLLYHTLHAISS
jgi:hypothetical protein